MQASYETTSVGSQTEYQPMDTRGNKNFSYSSIMADYVSLTITFGISKSIKGEVSLSHFIPLHAEHYNLFGHDQATTCTLFIMQVLFKISSKNIYKVIIYPFYDVLYEVNVHCFLLSIQITVVSALIMYSTKSSMREELSPLTSPRLGSVLF